MDEGRIVQYCIFIHIDAPIPLDPCGIVSAGFFHLKG